MGTCEGRAGCCCLISPIYCPKWVGWGGGGGLLMEEN